MSTEQYVCKQKNTAFSPCFLKKNKNFETSGNFFRVVEICKIRVLYNAVTLFRANLPSDFFPG